MRELLVKAFLILDHSCNPKVVELIGLTFEVRYFREA